MRKQNDEPTSRLKVASFSSHLYVRRHIFDAAGKMAMMLAHMTPVCFTLNSALRESHSAHRVATGFAPASRILKFISSSRSSASTV